MTETIKPTCAACMKPADELPTTGSSPARMLVCGRCQKEGKRQVWYCSRECQLSHYPSHKPFCGLPRLTPASFPSVFDPSSPFQPPPALLFHLAALSGLPPTAFPTTAPPSFLYFPSTPVPAEGSSSADPPLPVPISLPDLPSRNLFNCLQLTAFRLGSPLAVNLMYSLLLTEVEALGGVEDRLVAQLSEEYRLDGVQEVAGKKRPSLREMLMDEEEPKEEELLEAIGGAENMGILVEWQMAEADRKR
ncbi:hypothetical protein JCM8097_000422 [Rhodosporidiobolus ruineniae]